jgi:hypothetical protein
MASFVPSRTVPLFEMYHDAITPPDIPNLPASGTHVDATSLKQHGLADLDSLDVLAANTPPKQRQATEMNVKVVASGTDGEVMERSTEQQGEDHQNDEQTADERWLIRQPSSDQQSGTDSIEHQMPRCPLGVPDEH